MKLIAITESNVSGKKMMAIFYNPITKRTKTTHFGSIGYEDFTIHKNPERKARYIARHCKNENWNDPTSAGALSRYILWEKPTLKQSISFYKKKFKFD